MHKHLGYARNELGYCSNVHPGESLEEVLHNIEHFISPVAKKRGLKTSSTGLWISAQAAQTLQHPGALTELVNHLRTFNIQLLTLNGFPYGDFHQTRVKQHVYQPDWSSPERLNYTMQLANVLAVALPTDQVTGSISTLPITYKDWANTQKSSETLNNLQTLCAKLKQLELETGKRILICFEMEPDCLLEYTEELIEFFTSSINCIKHNEYLGICYDVCHQAVMQEDIKNSLNAIHNAGITIGKIQISSALKACFSQTTQQEAQRLLDQLKAFCEPKYLHQVKISKAKNLQYSDLENALKAAQTSEQLRNYDWLIHFHVPIQASHLDIPFLSTTQNAILDTLQFLKDTPGVKPHLEVETYTWQVLPESLRPASNDALTTNIAHELDWLEQQLLNHNLLID